MPLGTHLDGCGEDSVRHTRTSSNGLGGVHRIRTLRDTGSRHRDPRSPARETIYAFDPRAYAQFMGPPTRQPGSAGMGGSIRGKMACSTRRQMDGQAVLRVCHPMHNNDRCTPCRNLRSGPLARQELFGRNEHIDKRDHGGGTLHLAPEPHVRQYPQDSPTGPERQKRDSELGGRSDRGGTRVSLSMAGIGRGGNDQDRTCNGCRDGRRNMLDQRHCQNIEG